MTINHAMTEIEVKQAIESRGLTVMAVYRVKDGLIGMSKERNRKGVHAYPKCTVTVSGNYTEIN